jgi:hypothetical protein
VIVTILPASPAAGVYVKANDDVLDDVGMTVPAPFSVIVTPVALPPNVFPLTATAVVPHVLPLRLLRLSIGGLAHPHDMSKTMPVVVHPSEFLTVIVWLPFETPVNVVPGW